MDPSRQFFKFGVSFAVGFETDDPLPNGPNFSSEFDMILILVVSLATEAAALRCRPQSRFGMPVSIFPIRRTD
jgi:hypothetical protein